MQRLEQLMAHVLEQLQRSEAQAITPPQPQTTPQASSTADREAVIARIRHARDVEHQQFQEIAEALNTAEIPTFSGRGKWSKANVRRFYKEGI
jgi:hypothetical protein